MRTQVLCLSFPAEREGWGGGGESAGTVQCAGDSRMGDSSVKVFLKCCEINFADFATVMSCSMQAWNHPI